MRKLIVFASLLVASAGCGGRDAMTAQPAVPGTASTALAVPGGKNAFAWEDHWTLTCGGQEVTADSSGWFNNTYPLAWNNPHLVVNRGEFAVTYTNTVTGKTLIVGFHGNSQLYQEGHVPDARVFVAWAGRGEVEQGIEISGEYFSGRLLIEWLNYGSEDPPQTKVISFVGNDLGPLDSGDGSYVCSKLGP